MRPAPPFEVEPAEPSFRQTEEFTRAKVMIQARSLKKAFGSKRNHLQALHGVSFECQAGAVHGILGPNGAGKTTCLRIVCGFLRADSGTVSVGTEQEHQTAQQLRRAVGYVSSTTGVYDRLTPLEFISHFARLSGLDGAELRQRVHSVLLKLNITDYQHRRCGQLSSGMKQRVSIARALVHNPQVIVFDEPTNGLDILGRRSVLEYLRTLKQSGRTVLLATNLAEDAENLCDTLTILSHGEVVDSGTLPELRDRYSSENLEAIFVKLFGEGE
jgi:sodium transport system ATP-binding protein